MRADQFIPPTERRRRLLLLHASTQEKAVLKAEKEAHDDEQRRNALKQDALASAAEAGRGDEVCDFCNNRGYCKEDNSGCLCTALWNGEKCDVRCHDGHAVGAL